MDTSFLQGRSCSLTLTALILAIATPLSCKAQATAAPARTTPETIGTPPPFGYEVQFKALLAPLTDKEYPDLASALQIQNPDKSRPPFDPTRVRYFPEVDRALALTASEKQAYKANGFVMVDHGSSLSMGRAYLEIYQADLPVLVTTDSILHALHRSYDAILQDLETDVLIPNLDVVLSELGRQVSLYKGSAELRDNLDDVALYVTVARNLLANVQAPASPTFPLVIGKASVMHAIFEKIGKLTPDSTNTRTTLYGDARVVDWSQFKVRGHYTKTRELQAYFRAMMWLGRADLAWQCFDADSSAAADRQLRDAALLAMLVERSGQSNRLNATVHALDVLVGRADSLGLEALQAALKKAGLRDPAALTPATNLARLRAALSETSIGRSQIRSQWVDSSPSDPTPVTVPVSFQLFGQRFVLDSYLLSKLVYDSIVFHREKQQRLMPSGLDVMAALGSNEAVVQLEPQIRQYNYASNLLAVRRLVTGLPVQEWEQNTYTRWLSAFRLLFQVPKSQHVPYVMRTAEWQRKQLQTALGSWAELRHDTILYAAQSYTAGILCEYPEGYVEPYPAFYAAIGALARQAAGYLNNSHLEPPAPKSGQSKSGVVAAQGRFFNGFAGTMDKLEKLAQKELAAQPFENPEKKFLKQVMTVRFGGGCGGPPSYDGWYPDLFYGGKPVKREPTVADVHTDPNSGNVLEAAVGDTRYLVVAVDNQQQRAAYVGPAYSYYEFTSPTRLTDDEWTQRIATTKAPGFTKGFVFPGVARQMRYPEKQRQP